MTKLNLIVLAITFVACQDNSKEKSSQFENQEPFPYTITDITKNRVHSTAINRSFNNYSAIHPRNNELYSQFKYTALKGLDYNNHDGTISRRDSV